MVEAIGLWSHALAALAYGALAVWQLRYGSGDVRNRPLVAAFAAMSAWAVFEATVGPYDLRSNLAESARNLAFLTFMYGIVHGAEGIRQRAVNFVYAAMASVIVLQIVLSVLIPLGGAGSLVAARHSIGLTIAAGGLVLVHNLYVHTARSSRWGIRLPVIALATMWAYDVHLYTVAYVTRQAFADLFALRGVIVVTLVPLFAVAARRNTDWRVQLSRSATFQSLSLIAIIGYFAMMISATKAMGTIGGDWTRLAQVAVIFVMTLGAVLLLPSGRARAWLHVMIAKHLFEHRYDYREDWLRFSRTLGRAQGEATPLEERVVKALAHMAGSEGGVLLAKQGERLLPVARWNWAHDEIAPAQPSEDFVRLLEETNFVVDFAGLHGGAVRRKGESVAVPPALLAVKDAWAGVPLVHNERLVGLVLLDHPRPRRPLDWEDYDLFAAAGIQAASYLSEAQSQEALGQAQRFEEFNRRFAFIMHDIKNLVSQLSLVARNAERHAGNPEFRADMVATLQNSVKKMNDLLARLSGGQGSGDAGKLRAMPIRPLLAAVADAKRRAHPIELSGDPAIEAVADPARLEQAVTHLVQNAIDASADGAPVRLSCTRRSGEAVIEIADRGSGMSPDFVRTRLFQPFASTKEAGFGIGAFEARTLVSAMGGRVEVDSREGEGTIFTIHLPLAEMAGEPETERMRA